MHDEPILKRLIQGDRFSYQLLRSEREAVEGFRNWWWAQANLNSLDRPKTLDDSEPILTPTKSKLTVDLVSDDFMFSNPLRHLLEKKILPRDENLSRPEFQQAIADHLTLNGLKSQNPSVIFTGGGYGAGKTSGLQFLVNTGKSPVVMSQTSLQGVDYCKQLLPEFSQVQRVADGRASEICQEESRLISDLLFCQMTTEKRTFGWDSSMSNRDQTLKKIGYARHQGYRTVLLAVLTPLEIAIPRAMERARQTRRFAPPNYLESSHRAFWKHLPGYVDEFDEVIILENSADASQGGPQELARKEPSDKILKIIDVPLYQSYLNGR